MSLLVSRISRSLSLGKPALVRRSSLLPLLLCNRFSSSSSLQTPPCSIVGAIECGNDYGTLEIWNANETDSKYLDRKVPLELLYNIGKMVTIGSSHGWVATLTVDEGILRLQNDLNPAVPDKQMKRIPLPPLVTLPLCQTEIVTNVSMSSSSPEDEDCVVAVKFLGPQLSVCRPARSESGWINTRVPNPCFYSSRVMFSQKDQKFRIPGSGGHLIGSWDLGEDSKKPKLQKVRFENLPKLTKTGRDLLDSCCTTEHLVESITTGETFLVKQYKKTARIVGGIARMQTKELMVFKLDEEGNAVYTDDIGDLCIFLSKSEPFCVPASSFPGLVDPNHANILVPNYANILDVDEIAFVNLAAGHIISRVLKFSAANYFIPPQNVVDVWN